MANEISRTVALSVNKGGTTASGQLTVSDTLVGSGKDVDSQAIGTAWEALTFPTDLTTEGITALLLKNQDTTNYVEIALDNAGAQIFARVSPSHAILLEPYSGNPTYYARAHTAAIQLDKVAAGT